MGKVQHGAVVKIVFDGVIIGVLTSLSENEDYGQQGVYGIGQFEPVELVNLRFSGNFNYQMLVLDTSRIANLKYAERTGKTLEAIAKDILTQEGFTIVVENKFTKANVSTINGCKMGNLSLSVGENQIVNQNGSGQYGEPVIVP